LINFNITYQYNLIQGIYIMARKRYKRGYRARSHKKRKPIKTSATYKKGMRNTAITFGALGVLSLAVFHKTAIARQILENTPTFNGEGS
jgi:hypothetical protein